MSSWVTALLGFGAIPGEAEEVRGFLQVRVRRFVAVLALFHVAAYALELPLRVWLSNHPGRDTGPVPPVVGDVAIVGGLCATYVALRRVRFSVRALAAIDLATIVTLGALTGWVMSFSDPRPRPEYPMTVTMVLMLVARAAVVPSPALRTAVVSLAAFVPIVIGTYVSHARGIDPPYLPHPLGCAAIVMMWALYTAAVTAFVARALYGLERRIRAATRLGQYTLDAQIGAGGMGVVYRARHALLRRPTAIKLLPTDRAGASAIERFEREVQHTAALTHPNTIAIFDFGRTPDGVFYYAMEYVDGHDLDHVVTTTGPLPPGRVVHLLAQTASALAEAHERGLVHRDVKPANLMLCRRSFEPDFIKVLDFGLARDLGEEDADGAERGITGTPLFLAPETTAHGIADARSDIYALGAVAWFLLYGAPVFSGTSIVQVCAQHLHATPTPPPGAPVLPEALDRLVRDCLAKDPAARPAHAAALLVRLRALADLPPWTAADAIAWWERWGHHLERPARDRLTTGPGASVAIDLTTRTA